MAWYFSWKPNFSWLAEWGDGTERVCFPQKEIHVTFYFFKDIAGKRMTNKTYVTLCTEKF